MYLLLLLLLCTWVCGGIGSTSASYLNFFFTAGLKDILIPKYALII
jgi:hypothetical protein